MALALVLMGTAVVLSDSVNAADGAQDSETDTPVNWQVLPLRDAVIDGASSISASANQKVTIDGTVDVVAGGELTIKGQLVINDGATLNLAQGATVTIDAGATVIVDGDLVIEGANGDAKTFTFNGKEMTVNGYVSLEGANSFISSTGKVTVNGTLEINDEASATLDNAEVSENGEILVYGDAKTETGTITNNGTITVDSEKLSTGFSVVMGENAVLDIINAYSESGSITASDTDGCKLILTKVAGATVSTATVGQDEDAVTTMYIVGTIMYAVDNASENTDAKITIESGAVEVAEDVTLGEGVVMDVKAGELKVSALMTVTDNGAKIVGEADGKVTVTGKIVTKTDIDANIAGKDEPSTKDLHINAVMYRDTSANYVYTTLVTAINADAAESVTVYGANTVAEDVIVTIDTTITMTDRSSMEIYKDATVTVNADNRSSGRITTSSGAAASIDVKGTLEFQNYAKSRASNVTITADTLKEVENARTYTNIFNAIQGAATGETVEVYRETLNLDANLTVPAGITLSIPANKTLNVLNDVTVTVDGTVRSEGTYTLASPVAAGEGTPAKAAGATIVNGMFLYSNGEYASDIVGAYFGYDGMKAIAPVTSVPGIIEDIVGTDITLYGKMTVETLDFSAYDGETAYVIKPANDLTFGTITLGSVAFDATGAKTVTGTIVLANGSIVLDNVTGIKAGNVVEKNAANEDVTVSTINGNVTAGDKVATVENETGSVTVDGTVESDASVSVALTVAADATLTVNAGQYSNVTVEGAMDIAGAASFADVTVIGAVTIQDEVSPANVSGNLFVGVSYDAKTGIVTNLGSGASMNGLVLTSNGTAYVAPTAEVGDSFDAMKSTAYYRDVDDLYVTAYVMDVTAGKDVDSISIAVENAVFDGWLANGVKVTSDDKVGADKMASVYADIITEIYNVQVTADNGIGTIAVDNIVLQKAGNVFVFGDGTLLEAGEYKILYKLNSGFSGDNVVISVNGVEITGDTITLSGNPANGSKTVDVNISVFGTEAAGQGTVVTVSGDDGMGLTDYLLIILVVLVVVMAILVATRLMRS